MSVKILEFRGAGKLKIMLLTHSFSPEISPPQRRWSIIADELASQGHQVNVVTPAPQGTTNDNRPDLLSNPLVTIRHYPSKRRSRTMVGKVLKHSVDALRSFPVSMSGPRPDVIIATVPALPTLVIGYLSSRLRRVPFVVDLRDAWPDLLRESQVLRWGWLEPLVSRCLAFLVRRSDLLVTVTNGLATKMRLKGAVNVVTVPNGVEIDRPEMKVPLVPRGDKLRVLYLGNLGRSQGLDLLVKAMKELQDKVTLRIVGHGTEKVALTDLAVQLGVDVDFREPVYGTQVLENYAWSDTCIVALRPDWPSFDHTVPSKLYELLYLDQHVTGLVRGEAAGIINASGAGVVVPQSVDNLVSHLNALIENPEMLRTNGGGSRWVRENASLRESGRKYALLLAGVVKKSDRS
ncbi:glycosyltransferase family 4 protein [Glutamicibacter arilaitensis]|uniref:glycosyltransferase family 4 protein n=1 Tax=Glutamicibacter arilaitensis TaxID=256701 RepID=UPI0038502295